ncbi:MAG TPA: DUF4340 domain-containing protein [Bryobacteraceae bacterium]|nr:DUF4340 domain-containing protein [Bryobacteraceae bacterium]
MRFRGMLVAVVVLIGLGFGLYYSEKQKSAEAAKPPANQPPKILTLSDAGITQLVVKKKGAEDVVLQRNKANKWEITAPKPYPADQDTAAQLATSASNISADAVVEPKATDLAPFGLTSPSLELDITSKGGKVNKFSVGDDTPTNSGAYAALSGDPRVFTVGSYLKTELGKSLNDLRDKRLLTFEQDKLSRVELLAKKQDIEFGRDKNQWQILKPKPLRADGLQVDELLRKLKDAKMDLTLSGEDAKKAASSFASGSPVATVKLTDTSGTEQIEIHKNKDDYYAKSSVVPGVYKVTAELGAGVDKDLDDFRNKKLFDFGFMDPNKVEMHLNGKFYGLQRSNEDWWSNGKKMDGTSVQSLLDKLRDLSASKFIDTGAFGNSVGDITVTSNDNKLVEKVLISKSGNDYIAKRDNEPALYGLDAKTVDDISKSASDVKPAPPPAKK